MNTTKRQRITTEQANEIIHRVYMQEYCGTWADWEFEEILVSALIRKGIAKERAQRLVNAYLDA